MFYLLFAEYVIHACFVFIYTHFHILEFSLGFPEIKKVDILWNDQPKVSRHRHGSVGELYLRVAMSAGCDTTDLESLISNDFVQVTDLIDWSRSHPDNVHDIVLAFGIEAGWKYFLKVYSVA